MENLKHILNPVKVVPLSSIVGNKFKTNSDNTHVVVVETEDGPKIVHHCSKDYGLTPNEKILASISPLVEKVSKFEVTASSYKDAVFKISLNFKTGKTAVQKGDVVSPRIDIYNSYNGKYRYAIKLGVYRLVCTNGMVAPFTSHSTSKKHTSGLVETLDGLNMEVLENFLETFPTLIEPFEILSMKKVNDISFRVEEVIENTSFPVSLVNDVLDRIKQEEKLLKSIPNDWLVYSCFKNQLNHSELIEKLPHKKAEIDREVANYLMAH